MSEMPRHPLLLQINARVTNTEIGRSLGRHTGLDDWPDSLLDHWRQAGFTWIYLLGVWKTGTAGRDLARSDPVWRAEFQRALPDLQDEDIEGSCFAITAYSAAELLGGDDALRHFHQRLHQRGLRLMLDFVPNHVALDHPWVREHPEFFIHASAEEAARAPENFLATHLHGDQLFLAHGRDPNFPGWRDTLQLDYSHPGLAAAMRAELRRAAARCDGLRCDMAMLLLPDVYARTWQRTAPPFWPDAILELRAEHPGFFLLAEVYWDLERELLRQGFSSCYDKRVYDHLREDRPDRLRPHLRALGPDLARMTHFIENHDEPRAAAAFPPGRLYAASVAILTLPGLRLLHDGQCAGRRVRVPVQLIRRPKEEASAEIAAFHQRVLALLRHPSLRSGDWQDLTPIESSSEAPVLCWTWRSAASAPMLIVINPGGSPSRVVLRPDGVDPAGGAVHVVDHLADPSTVTELAWKDGGLHLAVGPWQVHGFEIQPHR